MNANLINLIPVRITFFLLSVFVLLFPALRLGYPILHGDSGVCIITGFEHFAPIERPITYGLFIWVTSLSLSLWLVVFIQAVITTFVIYVFMSRVLKSKYLPILLFFTISILSLTTSIGYFVCQIKPDFFLPLILLAFYSFLISNGKLTLVDAILGIIVMIGLLSHLSHLPITTGLFLATLLLSLLFRKLRVDFFLRKYLMILVFLLSAWMITPSINYYYTGSFTLSRVSNIFSVSRLLQAGVFQKYVHDKCEEDSDFLLCKYVTEMDKYKTYHDFLWDNKSFLYDHECATKDRQYCWIARNEEFGIIVKDIYSHQKYLKMFTQDAIRMSVKQFFSFNIPEYASYQYHSYPMNMVQLYLPTDNNFLEDARQNKESLTFPIQNIVQLMVVLASLGFIIFKIIWKKGRCFKPKLILLGYMIITLLIGNAMFVGIFVGISDRFQSRLIWLIPLYTLILFFQSPGIKRWNMESDSFKSGVKHI